MSRVLSLTVIILTMIEVSKGRGCSVAVPVVKAILMCAGMAMVPFADLFNHKAAVVQLAGGYFVEDVCMEGAESSSDEESDDDPDEASDGHCDADDTKACQNDAAGDSSGDVHGSGDEQATTEVQLKNTVIAGGKRNVFGVAGGGEARS